MINGKDRRNRSTVRALVLAPLAIGGGFVVGMELGAVLEAPLAALDRALLMALRTADEPARPVGPEWLAIGVRDVTALGGHTLVIAIGLIVAGYLAVIGRWPRSLLIGATIAGAILLGALLKLGAARPRPEVVAHLVDVYSLSFPSSHALLAAVVYPTVGALLAGTQTSRPVRVFVMTVAIATTVLVGLTRLYLGVHWPTDVVAGWLIGGTWAAACWKLAQWIGERRRGSGRPGAG